MTKKEGRCMYGLMIIIWYFVFCCATAKAVAQYGSFLAVPVSDSWRHLLLILDYKRRKISVMCIISQIYAYFMLIFYVAANVCVLLDLNLFIASENANILFNHLLEFHFYVIFFSCMEIALYALINRFRR